MKSLLTACVTSSHVSPPARGAWIEIVVGHSVVGGQVVAPRTGGVD